MLSPAVYAPARSVDDRGMLLASSSGGSCTRNRNLAATGDPDCDLSADDDRRGDLVGVLYNSLFDVILIVYEWGVVQVFEPQVRVTVWLID